MPNELADSRHRVSTAALEQLRNGLRGVVLTPRDADYESSAAVWNRAHKRRPAYVVRCATSEDVAASVRFARSAELPLAVRGGGYSPSGMSSGDGVVVDLRAMHDVRVDPLGKTAVVAAGATWAAVDAATQRFGYAVPGVAVAAVGVAGSTIGGGYGHLRRAYGLACDNLIGADLIGPDGARTVTSGDLSPELLWGLRGGGGNFGIVTSMRFQLRPLPEPVLSGSVIFAGAHTERLLRFYRDYTARLREDVTTRFSLRAVPPASPLAQLLDRGPLEPVAAITVACVGHPVDAERLVRPVREAHHPLADHLRAQPYVQLQASPRDAYPPGEFAAMTSMYVDDLDDALIGVLAERRATMPDGQSELHIDQMGGAVGRVARMSTAVPNRAARYLISALTRWRQSADEDAHREWLDAVGEKLRPFGVGGPHVGMQSAHASSVDAYGAERYLRLAALKRRFDPDNVFRANQNIAPLR